MRPQSVRTERQEGEHWRLFAALWPDGAARAQAAAQRDYVEGRKVAVENLHVTLVFIGAWPRTRLTELQEALSQVRGEPFSLAFDRREVTRHGIAWLGMSRPPAALLTLQAAVAEACARVGHEPERRAYRPHLTLARQAAKQPAESIEPVVWTAREFALVRSHDGRYENVRRWVLGDDAGRGGSNA